MRLPQTLILLVGCQLLVTSPSVAEGAPQRSFLLFDSQCLIIGTNLTEGAGVPAPVVRDGEKFTRQCSKVGKRVSCLSVGQDGTARFGDKTSEKVEVRVAIDVPSEGFTASGGANPTQSEILVVLWQSERFVWMTTTVLPSMITMQKQCSGRVVIPEP